MAPDDTGTFERTLRDRVEYRRWWRTQRYAFTRYSHVVMGHGDDWFFRNVVRGHVRGVYYTLALITLLHRAKLLELNRISAQVASAIVDSDIEVARRRIASLKEHFLHFATRYWFVELTSQDQGIEMSQQWARVLGNDRMFEDTREEIERFEAWSAQRSAEATERKISQLTTVLAVGALWVGLLGANVQGCGDAGDAFTFPWWVVAGGTLALGVAGRWWWRR